MEEKLTLAKKEKVFISGPMKGIPDDVVEKRFKETQDELEKRGYAVFNPNWMKFTSDWSREEKIKIDFAALSCCDYIFQLPGWEMATGCLLENDYARENNIPVLVLEDLK